MNRDNRQKRPTLQLDFVDDGRAVAPVDIDGDGKLDLVSQSLQQVRVMRNPGVQDTRNFARFSLQQPSPNTTL